jgi:hypothetical protein
VKDAACTHTHLFERLACPTCSPLARPAAPAVRFPPLATAIASSPTMALSNAEEEVLAEIDADNRRAHAAYLAREQWLRAEEQRKRAEEQRKRADEMRRVEAERRLAAWQAELAAEEAERDRDPLRFDLREVRLPQLGLGDGLNDELRARLEDERREVEAEVQRLKRDLALFTDDDAAAHVRDEIDESRNGLFAQREYAASAHNRVRTALTARGQSSDRWTLDCPSCGNDLVLADQRPTWSRRRHSRHSRTTIRARCAGGCATDALVTAIEAAVLTAEEEIYREQAEQLRELFRPSRAFATAGSAESAWLVQDLIPAVGVTVMFGTAESMKTLSAVLIAAAVRSGRPWADRATQPGNALLYLPDGNNDDDKLRRIRGAAAGAELDEGALAAWPSEWPRIDLAEDPTVALLHRALDLTGARVVVLDHLGILKGEAREIDNDDMGEVLRTLGAVVRTRAERGKPVSLILIAHAGKDGQLRGAQAIKDNADHVLKVERSGDVVSISVGKQKFPGARPARVRIEGTAPHPVVARAAEISPPANAARTGNALSKHAGDVYDALAGESLGINEIQRRVGWSKRDVKPALEELTSAGKVAFDGRHWRRVE